MRLSAPTGLLARCRCSCVARGYPRGRHAEPCERDQNGLGGARCLCSGKVTLGFDAEETGSKRADPHLLWARLLEVDQRRVVFGNPRDEVFHLAVRGNADTTIGRVDQIDQAT